MLIWNIRIYHQDDICENLARWSVDVGCNLLRVTSLPQRLTAVEGATNFSGDFSFQAQFKNLSTKHLPKYLPLVFTILLLTYEQRKLIQIWKCFIDIEKKNIGKVLKGMNGNDPDSFILIFCASEKFRKTIDKVKQHSCWYLLLVNTLHLLYNECCTYTCSFLFTSIKEKDKNNFYRVQFYFNLL